MKVKKLEVIQSFMRVLQVHQISQNFANNVNVRPVRKNHKNQGLKLYRKTNRNM